MKIKCKNSFCYFIHYFLLKTTRRTHTKRQNKGVDRIPECVIEPQNMEDMSNWRVGRTTSLSVAKHAGSCSLTTPPLEDRGGCIGCTSGVCDMVSGFA